MPISELHLERHTPNATVKVLDDLVDVYAHVYNVPPYNDDPFFTPAMFRDRLLAATELPGFECLTAHTGGDGAMIGLVHGVTLPADRAWWVSLGVRRPAPTVADAQAGDIGWLRELMVLPEHANRGVGRRLHDEWVAGREQRWTALTCIPDNEPAHSAYLKWGYEIIGQIKHADDSPVYDAMILKASRAA
ncbi:GNAT family N-acetyltransferase [Kitasatospora sp. NPDC088779]|uniref:GNAT family N-acetyltransferase n=1 Tax=Kitasatospora sp. NPDC088779 TaxID=3154964 RepID=UPI003429A6A5